MSLINDALKRAEKSLNNNSSDQHKERIPSFDFEPSKGNKKVFVIALIGGTLFFSGLIALIMLLRSSPEPLVKTPPPNTATTSPFIPKDTAEQENPKTPEQDQETAAIENDETTTAEPETTVETPKPSDVVKTSDMEGVSNEPKKNLNEEFVESIVGLASKAFTGAPAANKDSNTPQEAEKEAPPKDYSLSTAKETLAMLEEQAKNSRATPPPPQDPIEEYVQNLSITGVMIANDGSQVLIDNQVYDNNSRIDPILKLELIDIKPHKIVIKAPNGKTYTKEF